MLIAHLSDPHIGIRPDATERFERAVAHVEAARPTPDILLITGDIADHGTVEEYEDVRKILADIQIPTMICPGNHDVRTNFANILQGTDGHGPIDIVLDVGGYRFLMLDSLVAAAPGERIDHGYLSPESLAWLDQQLGAGLPSFVCLHHPPVDIHIGPSDNVKLTNGDELASILIRHSNVIATLVGHAHTMCASTFAGRPLLIGGGITSTVALDQEDMASPNVDVAPTFAWHLIEADNRVVTHWRSLCQ